RIGLHLVGKALATGGYCQLHPHLAAPITPVYTQPRFAHLCSLTSASLTPACPPVPLSPLPSPAHPYTLPRSSHSPALLGAAHPCSVRVRYTFSSHRSTR